jgi:Flp pilus assembly protein TadG
MWPIQSLDRVFDGLRAVWQDRRGTTAVEMGLVAPALFMLLLGIAQFGYAFWLQNALDYAVTVAARCASVDSTNCGTSDNAKTYAANASGAGFSASVFTATLGTTCGGKTGNLVSGSVPVSLVIPFVDISLTLTSQACYPS